MALQYPRENPFFSNSVLKKEYRYLPSAGVDDEKDECGVTDAHATFSRDVNVDAQVLG